MADLLVVRLQALDDTGDAKVVVSLCTVQRPERQNTSVQRRFHRDDLTDESRTFFFFLSNLHIRNDTK